MICHKDYIFRIRNSMREYVCLPPGVIITHVVVSYNKSVKKNSPRGKFYHPRCEFLHGGPPIIRKYPNLRVSVWGNYAQEPSEEWDECPLGVPSQNSHEYSVLCILCGRLCVRYLWSARACGNCFRVRFFRHLRVNVCEIILSFLNP